MGTIVASIANIGTAFVIGFYYSWKLALVTIAFLPLVAVGGALQMKVMQGYAGGNQSAQEEAGKVSVKSVLACVLKCGNSRNSLALFSVESVF